MREELPTGTVTFLFTDVEGSTRLLHELGAERYAEALAEHRRVIRDACAARDGVEVDTQGDAFFFAFPTAPGAVAAASAFTESLAFGPIQVRVGLHTGSPLLTDEGYIGDDVHFGARVAASSHGGQVVLSAATAELVEGSLTDLGEHRLKDIAEAVPIFQLGDGSFSPLKTISNTNLPTPASSFVGRDDELLEVLSRFEDGARLVTLTGPGGTGKTRLAIEAAATLVPEFKAGVFWVGLATLRDPALVPETIAQTLGAKDGLAGHIADREILLLLDNLEQVVDCAPELSELLSACPNLTLLVTSRELLRVQGEVEYPVPPLADQEAIDLFCARSGLEPSGEISDLCRRLDSLPLAVELAAARTRALSTSQILDRLSQRLDLLKGGRDADPRQQTLRSTIAWSHELLSPDEQQLFARLSVFAGCTLEAADEVADADLDTLQSLVEKSLLRFTDERYWMLETIREFAGERLVGEPIGDEALRKRHARWYSELAASLGAGVRDDHQESTARLQEEHDNMRVALASFLDSGNETDAADMVWSLLHFWVIHGVREGYAWARRAVPFDEPLTPARVWGGIAAGELARFSGDLDVARRLKEEAIEVLQEMGQDGWIAGLLSDLSDIAGLQHDLHQAREFGEKALEIRRRLGAPRGIGHALSALAAVEFRTGKFVEAREMFAQARALTPPELSLTVAGCEMMIGQCARRLGDAASAREQFRSSLRVIGVADPASLPELLQEIGALALAEGRTAPAAQLLGASERLLTEVGMPRWDPDDYERTVAVLRNDLGERFDAQWRVGSSMSAGEAVQLALDTLD